MVDSRLVVDSLGLAARRARDQRDRDDEHPRGLRRAGLARAQGRLQVLGALLRLRARRPGLLHRGDAAPAPAAHAPGVRHRRGRERRPRLRRAQPGRDGDDPALRQRPRAGPATPRTAACSAARGPVHPRLRPALPVRPRGRHRRRARARGRQRPARRLQRRRRRRAGALGGREPARQAAGAGAAAVGDRAGHGRRCGSPACGSRTRWPSSCATAAGSTTASSRPPAARLRYTTREAVQRSPRTCGCASCASGEARRTATSARSRSSCATARACGGAPSASQGGGSATLTCQIVAGYS